MNTKQHGCREAARLISQRCDVPLKTGQRLRLAWHLRLCDACRRFDRQMDLLREAGRRWRSYSEHD